MNSVRNKRDFVERYKKGEFGNAAPTWDSVTEFLEYYNKEHPPDDQLFHLRNRVAGGATYYNQTFQSLRKYYQSVGFQKCDYYVSAMAPTDKTTIQGEVRRSEKGLELRYTKVRLPMREALATQEDTVTGLRALLILEAHLNPVSCDWLSVLLERYRNHIIEFSAFEVCWGTLPGYNTVFWEVRPDRGFGTNLSSFTKVY